MSKLLDELLGISTWWKLVGCRPSSLSDKREESVKNWVAALG
jgi:hypothetical protein